MTNEEVLAEKARLLKLFKEQLAALEAAVDPTDTTIVLAWPQDGWLCVNFGAADIKSRACNILAATRFAQNENHPYEVKNGMDRRALRFPRQQVLTQSMELAHDNIALIEAIRP